VRIADRIRDIPKSGIRDFFELVQNREDVISLGIGEPDFATPWHIREAAIYALEKGRTGYTSNLGLPRLRRAIATYQEQHMGVAYNPHSEILVSVGVSEAIDLALRAILNPGDEVLYHEPCYVSYAPTIVMAGGTARAVPTLASEGFALNPERLADSITPATKVLMLNFPTNPTGGTLDRAGLAAIAKVCTDNNLIVLTDEIYSELLYDNVEHTSLAAFEGMRERTLVLHGVSKAYAMTGWRIGFACGPEEIIDAMMKIHQYSILCAPLMGQDAAIEALERGGTAMRSMREAYELRRNYIVSAMDDAGLPCHKPSGTFYVFPDISGTGLSSHDFAVRLLDQENVAVVPGDAFGPGGKGHVRCSFATSLEKIKVATAKITSFCSSL